MNERKRQYIMLGLLVVLIAANLIFRVGGDSFAPGSLFSDDTDLENAYSARALRNMNTLDGLPALAFPTRKEQTGEKDETEGRNPFIFGEDKRAREEAEARLAEMREKRAQAEAAAAKATELNPPPVVTEPEPEPVRFSGEVLGSMQDARTGKRRISVRIKDDILIVGEGDRLPNSFTVAAITETEVRFREQTSGREVTVKLTKESR
ncbi:MAG: hypothetical protein QNK37_20775 [Acidobacteriota bacterium]|nr:hypothetical protein [Acidobacteriota bacterium]